MRSFSGGTAFITGGASGIGLALARLLAVEGMNLVLADLNEAQLEAAAESLTAQGASILPLLLDVRDEKGWRGAVAQAWEWNGGVHLLCNSAGVAMGGRVWEQEPALWRLIVEINLFGAYNGINALLPHMLESGTEGHIVNIASIAAYRATALLSAYTASKHALLGLSECLKLELEGTPIGVSVVGPGSTATDLGRTAQWVAAREGLAVANGEELARRLAVGVNPDVVASRILDGVRNRQFHILTHPETRPSLEQRFNEMMAGYPTP
jgi:NAD(P)-dependent dehydrogenase (short-subunit alcohol dehydrogenase family)